MITREEAISMLDTYNEGCYFTSSLENLVNEIYNNFEQQIARQEVQLNAYADKIYQQAQHIEILEKEIK